MCVCIKINKNISMMISRYKWKDTLCVIQPYVKEKERKKASPRIAVLLIHICIRTTGAVSHCHFFVQAASAKYICFDKTRARK